MTYPRMELDGEGGTTWQAYRLRAPNRAQSERLKLGNWGDLDE